MRTPALLALLFSVACTTLGRPDAAAQRALDYGPRVELSVCVLRDPAVSSAEARELTDALAAELSPYGIEVAIPWTREQPRAGFTVFGIVGALERTPLPAECDRLLALVGRSWADALWPLLPLPEVLGAVTQDRLRGYVVAQRVATSLNQRLGGDPVSVARHEVYHMLGCAHAASMRGCYAQVATWKAAGAR
jgi:hypothetical protein